MMRDFDLDGARKYANGLSRNRSINPFETAKVLKVLAEAGDEASFKKIVDYYVRHPNCDRVKKGEDILGYLEWACMSMDHNFATVGYRAWMLDAGLPVDPIEVGKTQTMFRKNYGIHYDLTDWKHPVN